jgi:hypothetical protein
MQRLATSKIWWYDVGMADFSDNILVCRGRDRCDYLQVVFRETTETQPDIVSLTRYSVPGRYDTYDFGFAPSPQCGIGRRIRYFTDTNLEIGKALALLRKDLDKDAVAKLLADACSIRTNLSYSRILLGDLLASIGKNTRSYRAVKKAISQVVARIQAERQAKKAKENVNG